MKNEWLEESKKSLYQKRLEEGKSEVHTTDDFKCSICGEEISQDADMSGYYKRRFHFEQHGLSIEEARYASLNIGCNSDVAEFALSSFANNNTL